MRRLWVSALHRYVRYNEWVWDRLPPAVTRAAPLRSYASLMHRVIRSTMDRRQYFGTFFFRNRPTLTLIPHLADRAAVDSVLTIAFLGCSSGAEVYSVLWALRSARPDLKIDAHAMDISREILEVAERGVYSLTDPGLCGEPIFARMTLEEMHEMFDIDRGRSQATIKSWLKEGITWHHGDAASTESLTVLGPQDMVVASNFLCHMTPADAEDCLRTVARSVRPGGYLLVSGIDLEVRTRVARDLRWRPVREFLEDIHEGDPAVRGDWPWKYWGLEPLNKKHRDWELRYAAVFEIPGDRLAIKPDGTRTSVAATA